MRVDAAIKGDLRKIMKGELKVIADAGRKAVTESTLGLKSDLRDEVRTAGMGSRLANTWRSKIYPNEGPIDTAGFVYSKAPNIIFAHDRGTTIKPVHGGRLLAIPTAEAPKKGTDGKGIKPSNFPAKFGKLRFVARPGKPSLLIADNVLIGGTGKLKSGTTSSVSKGRARVRQSRSTISVVMFILVPQVKMKKTFDIKASSEKWVDRMFKNFASELVRN